MRHRDRPPLAHACWPSAGFSALVLLMAACNGDEPEPTEITCGEGTELQDGECVATPDPDPLVPGHYSSPLVELQRLQGEEDHMHIQEVRYRPSDSLLFFCSYTFGVIDAEDPQDLEYLAQGLRTETPSGSNRDPGCHRLDWSDDDPDLVFTTHRKNIDFATFLTAWDLTGNPEDAGEILPVQILPALQEVGVSYEGLDYAGGYIYVATHEGGLAVYTFDGATFTRVGAFTDLENAWDVVVKDGVAVVADGYAGLATLDVSDPTNPSLLGRVEFGGEAEVLVIDGEVAYVAAGAAGMVTVDVSNPTSPVVLSQVATPGPAVGIDAQGGRAFVAAWNDTRVYDVSDPTAPTFIGGTRIELEQSYDDDDGLRPDITARTLGVAGYGDTLFIGNWWVPYSFQIHAEELAPYICLPETFANVGFGMVEVGGSATATFRVENQGTAPLTVVDAWADNAAFVVEPSQMLVPPGGYVDLVITYTASVAEMQSSVLTIFSDDPQAPTREAWLVANQPGLGVGVPMPETTGNLVDGETWSYTDDGSGRVTLLAYFATF